MCKNYLIKYDKLYEGSLIKRPSVSIKSPYVGDISINGETKLAQVSYVPGTLGNVKAHNTTTFTIIPTSKKLNLVAHGYCTKHGIWESTAVTVEVK